MCEHVCVHVQAMCPREPGRSLVSDGPIPGTYGPAVPASALGVSGKAWVPSQQSLFDTRWVTRQSLIKTNASGGLGRASAPEGGCSCVPGEVEDHGIAVGTGRALWFLKLRPLVNRRGC